MRTHTIGKCVCGLAIWKRIVLACGVISSYPGPQASVSAVIPNSQETPNSWRQDGHLPRIPLLHRVKRASRRRSRSNLPEGWWNALAAYKYRCNKTAGPLLRPEVNAEWLHWFIPAPGEPLSCHVRKRCDQLNFFGVFPERKGGDCEKPGWATCRTSKLVQMALQK